MYVLFFAFLNWNSVASDVIQESHPPLHLNQNDIIQSSLAHFLPGKQILFNATSYIDRGENILRVPNITRHDDKKKMKKPTKRTIQKIIKKHKAKRKYLPAVTQPPSKEKEQFDIYAKEDILQKNNITTTQTNQKKHNSRKWNKLTRYPMPFQKLGSNNLHKNLLAHKRNKRNEDRKDMYILNDLDEMQFLSEDKDYSVVKAHLQKHW